jgi:hypothetical protein
VFFFCLLMGGRYVYIHIHVHTYIHICTVNIHIYYIHAYLELVGDGREVAEEERLALRDGAEACWGGVDAWTDGWMDG